MSGRPLKLTIAALGGQGGGVLTDWLIAIAEHAAATSCSPPRCRGWRSALGRPSTIWSSFRAPRHAGREPVMALMPVPGDVDCVVASELAEAGRAIAARSGDARAHHPHRLHAIAPMPSPRRARWATARATPGSCWSWCAVRARRVGRVRHGGDGASVTAALSAPCCSAPSAARRCCPFAKAGFRRTRSPAAASRSPPTSRPSRTRIAQAESDARSDAARATAELPPVRSGPRRRSPAAAPRAAAAAAGFGAALGAGRGAPHAGLPGPGLRTALPGAPRADGGARWPRRAG